MQAKGLNWREPGMKKDDESPRSLAMLAKFHTTPTAWELLGSFRQPYSK
jgi:hypothetical protein